MKRCSVVWLLFGVFFFVCVIIFGLSIVFLNEPVGKKDIQVIIPEKAGRYEIAKSLNSSIPGSNEWLFLVSSFAKKNFDILPGTYTLALPANYDVIWNSLLDQSNTIRENEAKRRVRQTFSVTFSEGSTIDDMLEKLSVSGYTQTEELRKFLTQPDISITQQFSFLPERLNCTYGSVTSCAKYYYEGYLFPDTYEFFLDETPENITKKLLSQFQNKFSDLIRTKSNQELYSIIVLASILEKETGRPLSGNLKDPELVEERVLAASVFLNRSKQGMKWQSDPTVVYGTDKVLCQQFRIIPNCSFLDDPAFLNSKYNTYKVQGPPIGPIANSSYDTVIAASNPKKSEYLFFVADISGKKYFARTNEEHEANIAKLEAINESIRKSLR